MTSLYEQSVQHVPENLTEPNSAYKRQVWVALAGIIGFFIFYVGLSLWFLNSAKRLWTDAYYGTETPIVQILVGFGLAFLAVFMLKAFFFVSTKFEYDGKEITRENEPVLFDYLYQLADETGAPRPHKVYLSNRVNASVFYHLSVINLFWPSKKNLEIGLGLINVLNLGEFKAVLAHEFGHFAQKSMLVGRWVYIANQIANTIIARRDALDSFLAGLSRIDIRIAWIGWILSLIVWSIRSIVELFFRIVVLSQRALSREMEFQADLVAVSVTGSDALIHALHKLQAADAAYSSAINAVDNELKEKKAVEDIYALQSNAIEKTALILDDDTYGKSPNPPTDQPEKFRVFSDRIAQPPKMWSTHPPDQERERNAKERYIPASIDERSAWDLFADPLTTRKGMTAFLINTAKLETTVQPMEQSLTNQNKLYDKSYFDPKYRGIYLSRFFCQNYAQSSDCYLPKDKIPTVSNWENELYPETLVEDLEDFNTLTEEFHQLEAIQDKRLESTGDGIWHRGVQIRRKELPNVIKQVSQEKEVARQRVAKHDQLVRTAHLKMAETIGKGWPEYLKATLGVIHYAEHKIAHINDSHSILAQVVQIVLADGRVSSSEMNDLLRACNDVHRVLDDINIDAPKLVLDENILTELKVENWRKKLEPLGLGFANQNNINDWMNVVDGWVQVYREAFVDLRSEALSRLLQSERKVQEMVAHHTFSSAPSPSKIDFDYETLIPGNERPLNIKLNLWDRFISADGIGPSIIKFLVAGGIVGATIFMVRTLGTAYLSVYNGLQETVIVQAGDNYKTLVPFQNETFNISPSANFDVKTQTQDGDIIENFTPNLDGVSAHYVYNIAGAASMVKWTAIYGPERNIPDQYLGNDRWFRIKSDFVFEEPPAQIKSQGSGGTRTALSAIGEQSAEGILSTLEHDTQKENMIRTRVKWDDKNSTTLSQWFGLASEFEDFEKLLLERLERKPHEIVTIRAFQDYGGVELNRKYCSKYQNLTEQEPNNADYFYLAARCIEDETLEQEKFKEGNVQFPEHGWLAYASSYVYCKNSEWEKGREAMQTAIHNAPSLGTALDIDYERARRVMETLGIKKPEPVNTPGDYLFYVNTVENGLGNEVINGPDYAYFYLQNNELEKAFERGQTDTSYTSHVTAMVGCSEDAKREWIEAALDLDPNKTARSTYCLYGLAVRENRNTQAYMDVFKMIEESLPEQIEKTTALLKAGKYREAKKSLQFGTLYHHANLMAMCCIILDDKAPRSWKQEVNALLFANERPYFKTN